jgi:hypothetical protein
MGRLSLLSIFLLAGSALGAQQPTQGAETQATDAQPMPQAQPMPSMSELLRDVESNQKAAEAARENYTYHVHIETQEFNGDGETKKTITSDAESVTIKGVRVNRAVARNGVPLTPDEAKKESERIDKDVARDLERRSKRESKGEATDSRGDQLISASRFLELGSFSNPRREMLAGRAVIVADYAGDPKAKTRNPGEAAVRDLVGTVWIDEADRMLVKGEGHFLNDFKLLGGLGLDIHKGFSFSFQATKINDEVWLPAEVDARGRARAYIFLSVNGHFHLTCSDYRKFRANSKIVGMSGEVDENGKPIPETVPEKPKPQP